MISKIKFGLSLLTGIATSIAANASPVTLPADLVLSGPVESVNTKTLEIVVLGHRVVTADANRVVTGELVNVYGQLSRDGSVSNAVIESATSYVPNGNQVYIKGVVSGIDLATGTLSVGNTAVNYSGLNNGSLVGAQVGDVVALSGVQPTAGGVVLATRRAGISGSGDSAQGISGSGESAQGISGSGDRSAGISGSGNSAQGISGSGDRAAGISGSGNSTQGISGSGDRSAGISGSGESAQGISGSGDRSAGISGSGNSAQGISGSGDRAAGISGSGNSTQGISGSGDRSAGISGSGESAQGISGSGDRSAGISGSGNSAQGISGSGDRVAGISGSGDSGG